MRFFGRSGPTVEVAPGERVLATCSTTDGQVLAGTRDALYLAGERIAWEQVEAADWNRDDEQFRVSLVGAWGQPRVEHTLPISDPGRLLELVRERVTASVVLQRHVALKGRRGVRVIGRRAPRGTGEIEWFYEYDEGIDPADPEVHQAATQALAEARADVGLS